MPSPTSPRPIPVGKLVSVSRGPRPISLERALPNRDRELPWLMVGLVGGIGTWLVALLVLAAAGARPAAPRAAKPLIAALPAPPPAVVVIPAVAEEEVVEVRPVAATVALAHRLNPPSPEVPALAPLPHAEDGTVPSRPVKKACTVCNKPGAELAFVKDPPEAFRFAREEGKLVFMIHLSGNFEDRGFT